MPRKKKKRYVSDYIYSIEKHILPYGVIAIWSGVGSGKNGFIEGIHEDVINEDGTVGRINVRGLMEDYRVLLITSRKAKVTETDIRHSRSNNPILVDVRNTDNVLFDEYGNKSVVCTSAAIAHRIKDFWGPTEMYGEPFWTKFDFIVVDEFHSLIDDATFSESAFAMKCFIDKVYHDHIEGKSKKDIKPRMIFMSGTPDDTKILLEGMDVKEYDLIEKTHCVKPKKIEFSFWKNAEEAIIKALKKQQTVVYYMCRLDIAEILIAIGQEAGLTDAQIAVSVSDQKTNQMLDEKYNDIYRNKVIVESSLSMLEVLPSNIKLFITNGKNKEGINIKTIPDLLVIENHYKNDIIQICGRFRDGVKNVKVLYDARQFPSPFAYEREAEYQQAYAIPAANAFLSKLKNECKYDHTVDLVSDYSTSQNFIDYFDKLSRYVGFNPFTGEFEFNSCYAKAREAYDNGLHWFNELIFCCKHGINVEFTEPFFRNTQIYYMFATPPEEWIEMYFSLRHYVFGETVFDARQGEKMFRGLSEYMNKTINKRPVQYESLGPLLKKFGCEKKPMGKAENKKFMVVKSED